MAALLAWMIFSAPGYPIALLQVVDGAGKPIAGAVIQPQGLRTKPGPYSSGWYGWGTAAVRDVPNKPAKTDAKGYARVAYPKFVFERIETGTLCLGVEHPDYVPARPESVITTAPPRGAPLRVWVDYVRSRILRKALIARTDPIVLQKGATLEMSVKPSSTMLKGAPLFAQVSALQTEDTDFWLRPAPDLLITRRLGTGQQSVRAIQFDSNGSAWFSPLMSIIGVAGRTNKLAVELKLGASVHGRLDDTVSRPIRNGRAIAHVWPPGEAPASSPPQWHGWSKIREDGSFDINSLPEGQLEVVALCDGFVSTNGPGQFPSMHYPQKYFLGTNDLTITVGMEPTVCLEINVTDEQDKPLKDAQVTAWPNVRYGEWSATVLGGDCYNTSEMVRSAAERKLVLNWWANMAKAFTATSDVSGLAVIANLPAETQQFAVTHPRFTLPAVDSGSGDKRRQARITLQPGYTNRMTVRLERTDKAPIAHY